MDITLQSTVTCPKCGLSRKETMPTDACTSYWECPQCGTMIRPKQGDCCVYCSYGTVPCPPVQESGKGDAAVERDKVKR